jgi:hypothetical protein
MATFFKKALGLFVEFDEDGGKGVNPSTSVDNTSFSRPDTKAFLSQADMDKFEKHFEKLFNDANLPGPDYFEFWKMMETLEAHIPDERARIAAVFASLSIQGLTKQKLVESAGHYKVVLEKDKTEFERVFSGKIQAEVQGRQRSIQDLEKKIVTNSEMIQKLTKEITEAQGKIGTLKTEIVQEEHKLTTNRGGYNVACDAMLNKITGDIQKIQTTI